MAEDEQDITEEEARKRRIEAEKKKFNQFFDDLIIELTSIPLAEGIDQNSWLFAGCRQDLEKARTRILKYIERCLR